MMANDLQILSQGLAQGGPLLTEPSKLSFLQSQLLCTARLPPHRASLPSLARTLLQLQQLWAEFSITH